MSKELVDQVTDLIWNQLKDEVELMDGDLLDYDVDSCHEHIDTFVMYVTNGLKSKFQTLAYNRKMAEEFGREPKEGHKLVRNLMSKRVIEIEEDTPIHCDPSSETYWSM